MRFLILSVLQNLKPLFNILGFSSAIKEIFLVYLVQAENRGNRLTMPAADLSDEQFLGKGSIKGLEIA